jgi:cytochrome c-type biogenesis protein
MGFDVTYAGALLAGLLSFASPCVLPLVLPYLCFLGGVTLDQLTDERGAVSRRVFVSALAFVLGFTTVFVIMGAAATTLSQWLIAQGDWLSRAAGVVIVIFGLHFAGLFRLSFLDREARVHVEQRPAGLIGAYVVGLAFAFGWTPCVGPVLASILTLAAGQEDAWHGAGLLTVYSLGIGLPFLAVALFAGRFLALMRRYRNAARRVEQAMGVLLILMGGLLITGTFDEIGYALLRLFPVLGRIG